MILKIVYRNGNTHYIYADKFTTSKVWVKDLYKDFTSELAKNDPQYYADRYNFLVRKIQKETNMTSAAIDFLIDCEFEELDMICCIEPFTHGINYVQHIIATNQLAYLMSDNGKTIDRLI